jgi:hypothetical protein
MGRRLRYLPPEDVVVEITQRTMQGRHLFEPSPESVRVIVGVLAHAQQETGMVVHGVAFLSTHFHLLISPEKVEQMADFMGRVKVGLSKELGRLHDWPGPFYAERYDAALVDGHEATQISRLRYLLGQGCKEGLVASPRDWPGVGSARVLLGEERLVGRWVDRTALARERAKGRRVEEGAHSEEVELVLTPLPCWAHLEVDEYRQRIGELVGEIEEETVIRHREKGSRPLGAEGVCAGDPHRRSPRPKRRHHPWIHALDPERRRRWMEALGIFVMAYREAASRLREVGSPVVFPEQCFLPRIECRDRGG